jgi:hypothetical protein
MPWAHVYRMTSVTLIATLASCACGGRTQLVPAYQIGRLSADAVVASDAGVRVVVRTDAWPGPSLDVFRLVPVEMTFDNRSAEELRIGPRDIALVTAAGHRITPSTPADLMHIEQAARSMKARSLDQRVLAPDGRLTRFVYFPQLIQAEQVSLHIDLVSAATAQRFGRIEIPFTLE